MTARCDGCGADIIWRFTEQGARMPLDAEPTQETGQGIYVLNGKDTCLAYAPMLHGYDVERYMNHWATCSKRELFTRRKVGR